MKTVLVAFYNAYPPVSGGANVTCSLAKYLPGERYIIQLAPVSSEMEIEGGIKVLNVKQLRSQGILKVAGLFFSIYKFAKKIKNIAPRFVILQGGSWTPYHLSLIVLLRFLRVRARIIYHAHNVEYLLRKQKSNRLIVSITKWGERHLLKKSDLVTAVSEEDALHFENLYGVKSFIMPNGVDIHNFDRITDDQIQIIKMKYGLQGKLVLFMGLLDYFPNKEAIDFLIQSVFPVVCRKVPDAKLVLIGGTLNRTEKWIINPGVIPFQEVPVFIKACDICVAPIFSGSGTRIKILEYMAAAKPVVSATKGAEGIAVENEKNIVIADEPDSFADKIITLFESPDYAKKIGVQGEELAKEKYAWEGIINRFTKVLESYD